MARKHAFVIAIALGLAAVVGAVAAVDTARLGQSRASASTVASQTALRDRIRLLDRQEAALRRALARRPPKLPNVPAFAPVSGSGQAASGPTPGVAPAGAPRVQYVRPAPIVIVKHHAHGADDEQEHDGQGEHDD